MVTPPARILVADDEPAVRLALVEALRARGHHVVEAADGLTAYAELRRNPPDLAVLDVAMPGLPGDEILRRLRFLCSLPGLPVLAITGQVDPALERRTLRAGATRVLRKPFDLATFHAAVDELLAGPSVPEGLRLAYRELTLPPSEAGAGLGDALELLLEGLDRHDPHGPYHSIQVSELAVMIGREMGMGEPELTVLRGAGLLHDTGKLALEPEVLRGTARLDGDTRAAVRRHPLRSARLAASVGLPDDAVAAVRHHHERWDGGGYPEGLRGEAIPVAARILAGAETFAALTTRTTYGQALPPRLAVASLRAEAGHQLDPAVVTALEALVTTPEECSKT